MCMWCICIPFEWHFTAFTCIQLHVLRCHITAFLWVAYYLILGSFYMRFILSLVHCFAFYRCVASSCILMHDQSAALCCIVLHFDAFWCILMRSCILMHDQSAALCCIMLHFDAFWCILMHFDAIRQECDLFRMYQNVSECCVSRMRT